MRLRALFILLVSLLSADFAVAQDKKVPAEAPGPWLFGTIGVGHGDDKVTALKGVAIKVGEKGEAAIAYDLDLCRIVGVWTGGKFTTPMNLMSRGDYPTALGEQQITYESGAGFEVGPSDRAAAKTVPRWIDPRAEPFGPLPEIRYRGMYVHGPEVALKWDLAGVEILETPGYYEAHGFRIFTRHLQIAPHEKGIVMLMESGQHAHSSMTYGPLAVASVGVLHDGRSYYWFPPSAETSIVGFQYPLPIDDPNRPLTSLERPLVPDFSRFAAGGPAHWPGTVETAGELSTVADKNAYVVDSIKLPDPNPWGAPMFLGGVDFFSDGRAAVCTFHGDVFIVSGLDEKLEHVTWKRFATGLYHALGLKIVKDEIYVTGRDGITRLRDLNGDGEADFYEAFNFDVKVTKSFHEFVFDLQTDPAGNFYFAKAGPVKNGGRGFDQICAHHGCLFRVSPDGRKFEVVATGFRAPNGIGVGPNGEMTSGDNEGTWTPACRLNWIKERGFYGVVPLAHWPNSPPTDYDKPLCWLPKRVDNSSGSQVWAGPRWGPWSGELLHLSYGACTLFGVLKENVHIADAPECCDSIMQGGVTAFPLKFQSGIMRARFSPADGQLYVAGLRGWQTTGLKNGCFQRVRYTGQPVRMPIGLAARKGGVEVKFTVSLDTQQAVDPENWSVEVWNYLWSSAYGSPEVSTLEAPTPPGEQGKEGEGQFSKAQMSKPKHDTLTIKSIAMGTDDRTVFLELPDLKPVMQMSIKFHLKSADGQEMKGEIVNTINALGE